MQALKLSLKNRINLHLLESKKKNMIRSHRLDCLVWESTLRSNLVCTSCDQPCVHTKHARTDMPLYKFFEMIDSLPYEFLHRSDGTHMNIMIAGGEPLLRTDLEECGRELYKRNIPWGIVTNALGMTNDRLNQLIRSGLTTLKVQLDTRSVTNKRINNSTDNYENVLNTLRVASQYKGIDLEVSTSVNINNVRELGEIKDFLLSCGIKKWRLFSRLDFLSVNCKRTRNVTDAEIEYLLDFVNEVKAENKVKITFACDNLMGTYEDTIIHKDFFFCKAGISMATVFVDGSVGICLFNRCKDCMLGNIYTDNLYDLWENDYNKFLNSDWAKSKCSTHCNFQYYCTGRNKDKKTNVKIQQPTAVPDVVASTL